MRLAAWRKEHGHTQEWVAAKLACSQSHISQIERANDPIVPSAPLMSLIFELTAGAVQPNDFYDLPHLPTPPEFATTAKYDGAANGLQPVRRAA